MLESMQFNEAFIANRLKWCGSCWESFPTRTLNCAILFYEIKLRIIPFSRLKIDNCHLLALDELNLELGAGDKHSFKEC